MQAVGALAGGIVHEFNNLHCGMRLVIETALAEIKTPPPIRKDLETVLERLERADSITGLLRTFARKTPSQRERVDLATVVEEALEIAAPTLNKDRVSVELNMATKVPELVLDRVQMAQALLNLILNARDAMESAVIRRLRIDTGVHEDRAFVRLSDTGCGIAAQHMDSIFDPFFTTKEDRGERVRRGFGLGLTVSEAIVRDHGGAIDVSSTVGAGSTFTVFLPLDVPSSVSHVKPSLDVRARVNGKRILVAENDSVLRALLDNALRRWGCVVETTTSADDSMKLLAGRRYYIAIIDLDLPPDGAGDVFDAVRKKEQEHRPIIILVAARTAAAAAARRRRALPGVHATLYKPLTLDSLHAALDAAIEAKDREGVI
jgi:CheY-like chemotaxis protein